MSAAGVVRRRLESWLDPELVYDALVAGMPYHVWRDRGIDADTEVSFLGWPGDNSTVLIVKPDGTLRSTHPDGTTAQDQPSAQPLNKLAESMRQRLQRMAADSDTLGWWGWLGFELCCESIRLPATGGSSDLAVQLFVDRGLEFDHEQRTVTLLALRSAGDAEDWLQAMSARLAAIEAVPKVSVAPPSMDISMRHDRDRYLELIAACRAAIVRGDAYQICLTNQVSTEPGTHVDPLGAVHWLRRSSPAPQAGVVRSGEHWLISASPEDFLKVSRSGHASTSPIKGTRRRSDDAREDRRLVAELLGSEKERAENIMIVDLMRNDLSRVSRVGSVEVTQLFGIDSYPSVHQLVSTVEADLGTDAITAIVALVPPGSMTGAPKHSAVSELQRLEGGPRGAYSGVWGRCSVDGSADIAVVIRTIEVESGRATIGSGGGITALSVPAEEWDEVMLKAGPLAAAVASATGVARH
jgi:para-aminobenzoate synthetase component 1